MKVEVHTAMIFRSTFYVIKQALVNLWRNRTMTIASVVSVTATLMILGIIFLLIINISNFAEYASDQFDVVQVFLEEDLTNEEMRSIGDEIEEIAEVASVTFESKSQALEKMKQEWDEYATVLMGLENRNPLPDSYIVHINNIVYSDNIAREMTKISGIEEIKYYRDVILKIRSIKAFIRNVGISIIVILLFVSTFVISNTIKLAVTSRKNEIQIMKYVGATHWFIRWPFILEGTLLGVVGALLAAGLIQVGYSYTYELLTSNFYVIIAAYIVPVSGVMVDVLEVFLPVGAGIGALGSMWGVKRYLNV
jgi:cell division transport system permease protein